jgi:hypothetical protein
MTEAIVSLLDVDNELSAFQNVHNKQEGRATCLD